MGRVPSSERAYKYSSATRMHNSRARVVYRFGKEDNEIRNYLRFRRMVHNVVSARAFVKTVDTTNLLVD